MAFNMWTARTTDGSSTAIYSSTMKGGEHLFHAQGTWDGATMTLQYTADAGTTWLAAGSDTTLTANGSGRFTLPAIEGTVFQLRATISGSGASTSLSAGTFPIC